MPSATGSNWEKYQKKFADDEQEEKKITPLTDEYVHPINIETTAYLANAHLGTSKCSRHTTARHTPKH